MISGLFLVRLEDETRDVTDSVDNETENLPKCIERKTVTPEIATKLYSFCDSDMPCHCKDLNLEEPKFLSSMCDIIPTDNCSMFPYCDYCKNENSKSSSVCGGSYQTGLTMLILLPITIGFIVLFDFIVRKWSNIRHKEELTKETVGSRARSRYSTSRL